MGCGKIHVVLIAMYYDLLINFIVPFLLHFNGLSILEEQDFINKNPLSSDFFFC